MTVYILDKGPYILVQPLLNKQKYCEVKPMTQTQSFTSLTVFPETREIVRAASARSGVKICHIVDRAVKEYFQDRRV